MKIKENCLHYNLKYTRMYLSNSTIKDKNPKCA